MTFSETFLFFFGAFSRFFFGVKFGFRKSCLCKRNDKYEVCSCASYFFGLVLGRWPDNSKLCWTAQTLSAKLIPCIITTQVKRRNCIFSDEKNVENAEITAFKTYSQVISVKCQTFPSSSSPSFSYFNDNHLKSIRKIVFLSVEQRFCLRLVDACLTFTQGPRYERVFV